MSAVTSREASISNTLSVNSHLENKAFLGSQHCLRYIYHNLTLGMNKHEAACKSLMLLTLKP